MLPGCVEHLEAKIANALTQARQLRAISHEMRATEDKQVSLTDPDARSMATCWRGTGVVGYNVQTAVDVASHLVIADEVTHQTQGAPRATTGASDDGSTDALDIVQARLDAAPQ